MNYNANNPLEEEEIYCPDCGSSDKVNNEDGGFDCLNCELDEAFDEEFKEEDQPFQIEFNKRG